MDRSTSVPREMGEQSLTPGEQRILALMEQGQQRLDQRLQSLEEGQQRTDQRLQSLEEGQQRTDQRLASMDLQLNALTLKVDQELVNSKIRDRQLAAAIQELREEQQERGIRFLAQIERSQQMTLETLHQEMNKLRSEFFKRFDQHDTRLGVVEKTLERHDERLHEHGQALQGLQLEVRKLTAAVERQTQPPRGAASP
ncbi:hypothetical protein ATI61_106218 [Archangium gephyra]|uniref:Uncharacterized protein n=1 Tax=Archangium gephyra TaxID=48 RepID=A0AAC8TBW5_9BACT|nr:hypothetical protein [Archangium gephyra]AKI98830.1 Hypothetical protein AA314_00457 [Archangium gephyra]REG30748.1 hypothetical protein ATI61_106218 [Archangium gephyra]